MSKDGLQPIRAHHPMALYEAALARPQQSWTCGLARPVQSRAVYCDCGCSVPALELELTVASLLGSLLVVSATRRSSSLSLARRKNMRTSWF